MDDRFIKFIDKIYLESSPGKQDNLDGGNHLKDKQGACCGITSLLDAYTAVSGENTFGCSKIYKERSKIDSISYIQFNRKNI